MTFATITFTQVLLIISIAVSVGSLIYQMMQSEKKLNQAASLAAADAKKGFEMVVEGQPTFVPKVYGRAKIGGTRVYHNTAGNYKFAIDSNCSQVFQTGFNSYPAGVMSKVVMDIFGNPKTVTSSYAAGDNGQLSEDKKGAGKNEFLYFQQVLCQGPINRVIDVIIDETRYLNDPALSDYITRTEQTYSDGSRGVKWDPTKSALRINCFNSGGVADAIMSANFNERSTSTFDGLAYISAIVRLDRDSPQFSGVPNLQFLIEGSPVRTVVGGVLSATKSYSNNPAWCLLDYLLDKDCGKGLYVSSSLVVPEIDLASFEAAAAVCGQIVQGTDPVTGIVHGTGDVVTGGKIWVSTDGLNPRHSRPLPLYECNIITDPAKSVRDNIEAILETMGDARLIWSGGKYRLRLQYVNESYTGLDIAVTLTDDDLVLDQTSTIVWPSGSQRLNHATVRFHNECEDFKEDSVSWPSKITSNTLRSMGGYLYSQSIAGYDEATPVGVFLNSYGVWEAGTVNQFDYQLLVPSAQAGAMTLQCAADAYMEIKIRDVSNNALVFEGKTSNIVGGGFNVDPSLQKNQSVWLASTAITLGVAGQDKVYSISIVATPGAPTRAVAAKISTSSYTMWTTRSTAENTFVNHIYDATKYNEYLAEDSNLQLETDVFFQGITDPYHALAKAEEFVRTSRSAFTMTFKYVVRNQYLEPGDYIKLQSEALYLGSVADPLYLKVESVKMTEGSCELTATRYDWAQLAWSSKANALIEPKSVYNSQVIGPAWLTYKPRTNSLMYSSGSLQWAASSVVDQYILYAHTSDGLIDATTGVPVFNEIGRTTMGVTTFDLPLLSSACSMFGVKTSMNGRLSKMTYTDTTTGVLLANIVFTFPNISFTYNTPTLNTIYWSTSAVLQNGISVGSVTAGSALWVQDTIYIYYALPSVTINGTAVPAGIYSTTSINVANSGKLLATYSGGSNGAKYISTLIPPVNIYVENTSSVIFKSPDLKLTWEYAIENDTKVDTFSAYLLQIADADTGTVCWTEIVTPNNAKGGSYLLTQSTNASLWTDKIARRKFKVNVFSVDTSGALSAVSSVTVDNPIPLQPTMTIDNGFDQLYVNITPNPATTDTAGYCVWVSTDPNFIPNMIAFGTGVAPNIGNLAYIGNSCNAAIAIIPAITYYVYSGVYDTFDKSSFNYSAKDSGVAVSITASSDVYTYEGMSFKVGMTTGTTTVPTAPTNKVTWTSFVATVNGDTAHSVTVAASTNSGDATWVAGKTTYYYYVPGNTTLQATNILLTAINGIGGVAGRVLATYRGGTDLTVGDGKAFISGDQILAGTVGASTLVTGSAVITGPAQIATAIIKNSHLSTVQADKITVDKLNVTSLSSLNPNVGILTSGKIVSKTGNFIIDFDNEYIQIN